MGMISNLTVLIEFLALKIPHKVKKSPSPQDFWARTRMNTILTNCDKTCRLDPVCAEGTSQKQRQVSNQKFVLL